MSNRHKDRILELTQKLERRGLYLLARIVVVLLFLSILFFPSELQAMLETPALLGALLFANVVLIVVLLADLLYSPQKTVGALIVKYIYLTFSIILAYGIFFYIDATILQPPGLVNTLDNPSLASDLEREVFYLSGATYFTIGYGDIVPVGILAKTAAISEALFGFVVNLVVLGKAMQSVLE